MIFLLFSYLKEIFILMSKDFAQLKGAPGTIKRALSPSIETTVLSGCRSAANETIQLLEKIHIRMISYKMNILKLPSFLMRIKNLHLQQ